MKSTKKSLIASALSLVLCISMLLGTTYAWFTDSVTSGKNQIIAGNLDVELVHSNPAASNEKVQGSTDLFKFEKVGDSYKEVLWEPGMMVYENFTISNEGTLAFKYNMAMAVADYNELNGHNLLEVLKVAVIDGAFVDQDNDGDLDRDDVSGLTFDRSVSDFTDTGWLAPKGNTAHDPSAKTFGVVIYWEPTDHDNDYNANNEQETSDGEPLFVELGVNVIATQKDYEKDSFDKNYDLQAPLNSLASIINVEAKGNIDHTKEKLDGEIEIVDKATGGKVKAVVPAVEDMDFKYRVKDTDEFKTPDVHELNHDDTLVLTFKTEKVEAGSVTYEISLMNETHSVEIAETNKVVTIKAKIGANLNGVKVKHNGVEMNEASGADDNTDQTYWYEGDMLTINTKSFSPFEVSWTVDGPVAEITKVDPATVGDISVYSLKAGLFSPVIGTTNLATAYNFHALDTTTDKGSYAYINGANEKYSLWHADFVVTIDGDLKPGSAGLWGEYEGFPDIGILADNDEGYTKGTEVRLLELAGKSMTYGEICRDVVNFKCGAFNLSDENIGKTMTVELRLYETEDDSPSYSGTNGETGKYITLGVYTYTFANTQTLTSAN